MERKIDMARILLVDDDEQFRKMLHKALERAGYEVQDAQNGDAALEMYRQCPSDLIITDLVMPEKEGIETIVELRRLNPAVKIIAISGGGRMNPATTLAMAQKLGARRTLAKPFAPHELLDTISQVLAAAG
jgi:CheY-like chemotaxis protein